MNTRIIITSPSESRSTPHHSGLRLPEKIRRRKHSSKAITPTISTVILTGTIVSLLMVTLFFVNNFLWANVAESDFNSSKQYMQNIGLQIDDVAWTIGRRETVRYASSYGSVSIEPNALRYIVNVNSSDGRTYVYYYDVGIIQYGIPISIYSIANNYYENIFPQAVNSLTFSGTSAPVARVFTIEKYPMNDESLTRVVVAPAPRIVSSLINGSENNVYYLKMYIPLVVEGDEQGSYQSVTMTGSSISTQTVNKVTSVKVTVEFPKQALGFDNSFFNFPVQSQSIVVPSIGTSSGYTDVVLEVYAGQVETVVGVQI